MWMRTHSGANQPMVYNNRLIATSGTVSISMQSTYVHTYIYVQQAIYYVLHVGENCGTSSQLQLNVTFWQRQTCIVPCCINYCTYALHYYGTHEASSNCYNAHITLARDKRAARCMIHTQRLWGSEMAWHHSQHKRHQNVQSIQEMNLVMA